MDSQGTSLEGENYELKERILCILIRERYESGIWAKGGSKKFSGRRTREREGMKVEKTLTYSRKSKEA